MKVSLLKGWGTIRHTQIVVVFCPGGDMLKLERVMNLEFGKLWEWREKPIPVM
jgi:hypothetical protein